MSSPDAAASSAGHLAQVGGPRVLGLVDPVPEAHDLLAGAPSRSADHRRRPRPPGHRPPVALIGLQPPHDLLVGPAVQRALERADRGDHRRVHVGQGGGADPGGERGRVHGVVGVQHQAGVQDLGLARGRRRVPRIWSRKLAARPEPGIGGQALTSLAARRDRRRPGPAAGR